MGRRVWIWLSLCVVLVAFSAGLAGAQGASQDQYANQETDAGSARISSLEGQMRAQDATLRDRIDEISAVGRDLQEAQAGVGGTRARVGDLRGQTQELEQEISAQRRTFEQSKAGYEEQARAAYRGDDLEGITALLDGWLDSGRGLTGGADPGLARILLDGRRELDAFEQSRRTLRNTLQQISQKERDYERAVEEQEAQTQELRRRERALDQSIAGLTADRDRTTARLQDLEAAERARILRSRAATGGGEAGRGGELEIAREGIAARPVGAIPKREYMKLYKESARKYGFGPDWYVLAAVGRVESDHGENMGPSSAGAMGPMQFMPSTWETSGVDGNGDGTANVMDPRDAIPAAARYLKTGGAPGDWYAALYSYNHADWYVKNVFAVAEAYRQIAEDDRVKPYT